MPVTPGVIQDAGSGCGQDVFGFVENEPGDHKLRPFVFAPQLMPPDCSEVEHVK